MIISRPMTWPPIPAGPSLAAGLSSPAAFAAWSVSGLQASSSALRVVTCVNGVAQSGLPGGMLSLLLRVSHYFLTFDGPATAPGIDLARWGLGGIPSIWCSPSTRQPGGGPRRNRHMHRLALLSGWRVVALREIDRMSHPNPLDLGRSSSGGWRSWRSVRRRGHFWLRADPMRVEYCLAKARPVTVGRGLLMHR